MKKNIMIIILAILVLGLVGILIYQNMNDKEEPKENENAVEETKIKEYKHYTDEEIVCHAGANGNYDYIINLKVENKKMVEKNHNLTINGITGNVKYFTYDMDCSQEYAILVLTEEGNIYVGYFSTFVVEGETVDSIKSIDFKQVDTKEKIADITLSPIPGYYSCNSADLAAVLENGEVHAIMDTYTDLEEKKYYLDGIDLSLLTGEIFGGQSMLGNVVFKDGTVGSYVCSGTICDMENSSSNYVIEKVKYQTEDLKVKTVYVTDGQEEAYIIGQDNRLYKLTGMEPNHKKAELVDSKVVKSTSYVPKENYEYFYEDGTEVSTVITFEDGSTKKISNIEEVLIIK